MMIIKDLTKQMEFFNPENIQNNNLTVHLIGIGAVGSFIAEQLIRMGINELHIWDFDEVEAHNIPNQVYIAGDIGQKKVDALEHKLNYIWGNMNPADKPDPDYTGVKIIKHGRWEMGMPVKGIVFMEVDSMKVRQEFVEDNEYNNDIKYIIDARIGLNDCQCNTCDWRNEKERQKYINKVNAFDDSQTAVKVSACGTTLSVIPTVMVASALACKSLINFINGVPNKSLTVADVFNSKMNDADI